MIKLHYFIGIAALATLSLTTASQAAVVYQSNFTTGTTLADADLASAGSSGSWADVDTEHDPDHDTARAIG